MAHILLTGISVYEPPVGSTEEFVTWTNLTPGLTTDANGNLFSNSTPGNTSALASKRLGGNGSWIEQRLAPSFYGSNGTAIKISDSDTDTTYDFTAPVFLRFYDGDLNNNNTKLNSSPSPLPDNVYVRATVTNGVDLLVQYSTDRTTWTTITTLGGVLTGLTQKFIKGIMINGDANRQLTSVKGFGLL